MPTPSKQKKGKSKTLSAKKQTKATHKKATMSAQGTTIKVRSNVQKVALREAKTEKDKRKKEEIRGLERKIRELEQIMHTSGTKKSTKSLTKKLQSLQQTLAKQRDAFMPGKIAQTIMKKIEKQNLSQPLQLVKEIPAKLKASYSSIKQWEKEVTRYLQRSLTLAHKVDEMNKKREAKDAIHKMEQQVISYLEKAKVSRKKAMQTAQIKSLLGSKTQKARKKEIA